MVAIGRVEVVLVHPRKTDLSLRISLKRYEGELFVLNGLNNQKDMSKRRHRPSTDNK